MGTRLPARLVLLSLLPGFAALAAGDGSVAPVAEDGPTALAGKAGEAAPAPTAPAETLVSTAAPPLIPRPDFLSTLVAPGAMAKFTLAVAYDQATDQIPEWGPAAAGLRRRAQILFGGHVVDTSLEYSISGWRHTDFRYARCQCKRFPARARHAILGEFTERRADGGLALPISRFAGAYSSTLAAIPFLPSRYGALDALNRGNMIVATDLGFNFLQEFWPEIKRALLHGRFRPAP
jgi:hypothetical protein